MPKNREIELKDASYLSLSTQKRSGDCVATPVWFAQEGDDIYIFSAADAGKVKRLKNFPAAKIASCTVNGKIRGEWLNINAHIIDDPALEKKAHKILVDKYGWQMKWLDFFSGLFGRKESRAFISIKLNT